MVLIEYLFSEKLVDDNRDYVLIFSVGMNRFGVKAPILTFWMQFFLSLIFQSIIIVGFAIVIYQQIVKKRGSTSSFIIGYGCLIPLAIRLPYFFGDLLGIENLVLRMSLLTTMTAVVFRCLESMHDTSPDGVEHTLQNYLLYITSVVEFQWENNERRKLSRKELLMNTSRMVTHFLMLSLLMSFMINQNFQPFESKVNLGGIAISWDLFKPGHLMNNYILAYLTYLTLSVGLAGATALNHAQGYAAVPSFRNPFFQSDSPATFWGKNWNMVAHGMLKRGVYKVVHRYANHSAAVAATFAVSGLMHDYSWHVMGMTGSIPLKQSLFFLYCGVIMLQEKPFLALKRVALPLPILSTLVVLTVLPVSHWFTGDMVVGGYYEHYSLGLMLIEPIVDHQ